MKGLCFTTPNVQAVNDDRKTMTRRVINPQPKHIQMLRDGRFETSNDGGFDCDVKYIKPPYKAGEIVYLKETYAPTVKDIGYDQLGEREFWKGPPYYYRADTPICDLKSHKWKSGRFMPETAARTYLRIAAVRVERVQDIWSFDCHKEGCPTCIGLSACGGGCEDCAAHEPKKWFAALWDSINAKRGFGWEANPWVWVITFEKISREEAYKKAV
jgi:hypothetical protein